MLEIALLQLAAWLGDLAGAAPSRRIATPRKMPKRQKVPRMQKMSGMLIMLETRTNNAKSYGFNHKGLFYHNGLGTNGGGAAVLPLGGFQSAAPPLVVQSVLDTESRSRC